MYADLCRDTVQYVVLFAPLQPLICTSYARTKVKQPNTARMYLRTSVHTQRARNREESYDFDVLSLICKSSDSDFRQTFKGSKHNSFDLEMAEYESASVTIHAVLHRPPGFPPSGIV